MNSKDNSPTMDDVSSIIDSLPTDILDHIDNGQTDDEVEVNDVVEANHNVEGFDGFVSHFNETLDRRAKIKLAKLASQGQKIYILKAMVPSGPMVGIQVFMLLEKLSDNGDVIATLPEGDSVSNGKFDDGLTLLLTHKDSSVFSSVFKEAFNIEPAYQEVSREQLGVEVIEEDKNGNQSENDKVDFLISQVENLMLNDNSVTMSSGDIMDGSKQINEIKVKVDDMNKLFRLVEELVLIRNQFIRINETQDYESVKDLNTTLDRTTNDMYLAVLKLRMVSIGQIFNHLRQFVTDLSGETGKFIDFIIQGEDVSVDRKILEELVDPMKGLISNAVIHGIEKPDERIKKGKARVGTITLVAQNEDESIRVTVTDDGRGITADEIRENALGLGLTSDKIVDGLTDSETSDLLTLPGFSTLHDDPPVNEMGMNAIKQRVDSNGGTFEIDITGETGLSSTVVLPTNVAIKRVLLFGVEDQIFAMPAAAVQTIMNLDKVNQDTSLDHTPLIKYVDKVIPMYNLGKEMQLDANSEEKYGIVMQKRNRTICVQVAAVFGFERVVVKSTDENLLDLPWISGLTVLSDGRATPILDLWSLIKG